MSGQEFRTTAVDARLGWTVLRLPEQHEPSKEAVSSNVQGDADTTSDQEDSEQTTGTKPFPKFVLYELTAGEHG